MNGIKRDGYYYISNYPPETFIIIMIVNRKYDYETRCMV